MSSARRFRESVDGLLDRWQARVRSLENRIGQTQEESLAHVEAARVAYLEALDTAKRTVAATRELSDQQKERLQVRLDETRQRVDQGRIDTRETVEQQRARIGVHVTNLEDSVQEHLEIAGDRIGQSLATMTRSLIGAADTLDAELEAASIGLETRKGETAAEIKARVEAMKKQIAGFRQEVKDRRRDAALDIETFELEIDEGWQRIMSSLRNDS